MIHYGGNEHHDTGGINTSIQYKGREGGETPQSYPVPTYAPDNPLQTSVVHTDVPKSRRINNYRNK